jgi:ribulose kinase
LMCGWKASIRADGRPRRLKKSTSWIINTAQRAEMIVTAGVDKAALTQKAAPPYVLCLDGGTESVRVGVFDSTGALLSLSARAYPTTFERPGWAEQKPGDWWCAVVQAVRECLEQAPVRAADIRGIALDATTCTLVALGEDLSPLRPALLWMDVRAARQAERIFATHHPAVVAYSPAGCNAEWMLSKALWMAENEPELYARTAYFVEYTDWLVYRFTGKLMVNLNTTTQRWYYNQRSWQFPEDLYAQVGIPDLIGRIPQEVTRAGQEVGVLLPEVARSLSLPDGVKVFQGGGDAFVALLGLNVTAPGKIGLITGSSNVIAGFVDGDDPGSDLPDARTHTPAPAMSETAPGLYGPFPDALLPGLSLVEGGQSSTGSILAWFKRSFAKDLPDREAYQILDREAMSIPPGSNGLIALDYFQGNRTPYSDSKARGAVWGLSLSTNRGQMYRAFMESVAYGTRQALDSLAGCTQRTAEDTQPTRRIFACGGATRSAVFMQLYADVCGIPISVVEIADAPLVGDAVLAFTGLGVYPDLPTASAAMVRIAREYLPDPSCHAQYQFFFDLYKDTYPQLKSLMQRAAERTAWHNPQ